MNRGTSARRTCACAVAVVAAACTALAAPSAAAEQVELKVLGTRADLVSAGDALIEVTAPALTGLRITVRGREVPVHVQGRRALALVTGLPIGASTVEARLPRGGGARLDVVDHPRGGPVFSGNQVQPWICTTAAAGLGPALDAQCNAPTSVRFVYKSAVTHLFAAYDPASPPPDATVARTTTDEGRTVPYVVRVERGTVNRGIYDVAVLADPAREWTPWTPQSSWNRKLVYTFGPGCGPGHSQGVPLDVVQDLGATRGTPLDLLQDLALGRGFAFASSTTSTMGNVCNPVVAAETVMMVKERITETLGPIRYTIGDGCSGGSESQNSIAENYPGLLDGIRPTCTFPDAWTPAIYSKSDCDLLEDYFRETSPDLWPLATQRAAVLGNPTETHCRNVPDSGISAEDWDPTTGCKADGAPWMYDPETNPAGTRCTLQDYNVAALGRRPDGRANGVLDDVGIEWGLAALKGGQITAEQFVDLNEKVGGWTIDHGHQPGRTVGDVEGIERMYLTGQLSSGIRLARTPSIDARSDNTSDLHGNVYREAVRERVLRWSGPSPDQVFWNEPLSVYAGSPEPATARATFDVMDRWLAARERGGDRPAEARDACVLAGEPLPTTAPCDAISTRHALARIVAGMPRTADVLKCRLKPLSRTEHAQQGLVFTDDQWQRLAATFPEGVCDWTRPGVGQRAPLGSWVSLSGGQPHLLGPEPVARPLAAAAGPSSPSLG